MAENTQDLAEFHEAELAEAGALLTAYGEKNETQYLGNGVRVEFNPNSGKVFLVDEDFNVAMISPETGNLEDFFSSPYDGHEGFLSDLVEMRDEMGEEDQEWLDEITGD